MALHPFLLRAYPAYPPSPLFPLLAVTTLWGALLFLLFFFPPFHPMQPPLVFPRMYDGQEHSVNPSPPFFFLSIPSFLGAIHPPPFFTGEGACAEVIANSQLPLFFPSHGAVQLPSYQANNIPYRAAARSSLFPFPFFPPLFPRAGGHHHIIFPSSSSCGKLLSPSRPLRYRQSSLPFFSLPNREVYKQINVEFREKYALFFFLSSFLLTFRRVLPFSLFFRSAAERSRRGKIGPLPSSFFFSLARYCRLCVFFSSPGSRRTTA